MKRWWGCPGERMPTQQLSSIDLDIQDCSISCVDNLNCWIGADVELDNGRSDNLPPSQNPDDQHDAPTPSGYASVAAQLRCLHVTEPLS